MAIIISKKEDVREIVGAIIDMVNEKCSAQAPDVLSKILQIQIKIE